MKGNAERIVLDLEEVTLVDLDVVRFLGVSQADGVELVNCSPYIREWISRSGTPRNGISWVPGTDRHHPECDGKDKLKGENQ